MRSLRLSLPGLNRQVALYLLHSALFYIGLFGISDVILNFYFVSLGYEPETIGLLQGLPRLAGLLTAIPVGLLANRIGARRITTYATLCAAATLPMMVIWPTLPMLVLSRFLLGLFFGATQIASAPLMMTLTANEYQTHQFSYHSVVTMSVTSIGSLLGGFLPTLIVAFGIPAQAVRPGIDNAQTPFAYAGALLLGGLVLAASSLPLFRLGDAAYQADQSDSAWDVSASTPPARPTHTPWVLLLWLSVPMLFFGFTGGLTFPFFNLFFRTTFALPDQTVGTIISLGWLGMGLTTLTNPWWDRRFGRALALGMAMSIAAAAFLVLSVSTTLGLAVIAFAIAISVRNMMSPLFQPLLMDSLPPALHNIASSTSFVLWNMGWFTATTISGFWQTQFGFPIIMRVVAIGVFITGLSVVLIFRNRAPYTPTPEPAGQTR